MGFERIVGAVGPGELAMTHPAFSIILLSV